MPLPPRSPQLNPVEDIWQFIRDNWLSNRVFKGYDDIVVAAQAGETGVLRLHVGAEVHTAADGNRNGSTITVYYKGTGRSMPAESGAKMTNLTSSNNASPAFYINKPVCSQCPFYWDFDSTGDNMFDVLSARVAGASWVATRRQSDPNKTTNIAFDLTAAANVYIMATKQSATPAWISAAGFTDTGVSGKWRDNDLKLVPYTLYERSVASGARVSLGSSAIDYVLLIK